MTSNGVLPNTLFIGAAKSGTTSICDDLALHPDVYIYPSKETSYFSFNYNKGEDWYKSLFRPNGQRIILDGSCDYTIRGQTAKIISRIHELLPNARLIYMVRHPVDRIESQYVQEIANGRTPIGFSKALRKWYLIDGSLYEKNLQIVEEKFGNNNIHVIFFEDYLIDKKVVLMKLFSTLGLQDHEECYLPRAASNTRLEKSIDAKILKFSRQLPGFYKFKNFFPTTLKRKLKGITNRKVVTDITWTNEDKDFAMSLLRPDTIKFLSRTGKPDDFWKFDSLLC